MTANQRAKRAGFTLIEILMVIAIIAVLAALLTTGIARTRNSARKVQAANDVQQLDLASSTAGFKKDFGTYPASHVTTTNGVARFVVPTNMPTGGTSTAQQQNDLSFNILQRMFPRWQPTDNTMGNPASGGTIIGTTQNTGLGALPLAGKYLDPNQCLVYFLGGPNNTGFDTASPYAPTGSAKKGPYYDFPAGRLAVPDKALTGYDSGNGLPNFLDPWGVPYAYVAAAGDTYDGRIFFPFGSTFPGDLTTASATYSGGTGMRPIRMGNKWVNPGKCQIVSAGPNRLFGPGTASASSTAASYSLANDIKPGQTAGYSETDAGEDDIANFNEGSPLGTSNAP